MSNRTYRSCPDCTEYTRVRASVLALPLARRRARLGLSADDVLDTYMTGVHKRHRAGLPILPGQTVDRRITAGRFAALMTAAYQED